MGCDGIISQQAPAIDEPRKRGLGTAFSLMLYVRLSLDVMLVMTLKHPPPLRTLNRHCSCVTMGRHSRKAALLLKGATQVLFLPPPPTTLPFQLSLSSSPSWLFSLPHRPLPPDISRGRPRATSRSALQCGQAASFTAIPLFRRYLAKL